MEYSITSTTLDVAFNLHSIINNGLIPGGQDSSRRQTVFFLPIDPRDKDHEDPEHIDFSVPRRARYVHSAWKKHQDAVFWVDIVDRGNLRIQKMCLLLKVKRPVPTRSMKNVCTKNLVLQIDRGNPEILSENIRVKHAHDGTGQPVEQNSSSIHTVKEQFAPEENRDMASFNADNEFNRAINEENIDFNVPGVPHSAVKRSHWRQRSKI